MHVACTHEYANVGFDKLEVESSNEVFPMAADPLLTRVSSPFSSLTIPPAQYLFFANRDCGITHSGSSIDAHVFRG